jgi:hypothetical protein
MALANFSPNNTVIEINGREITEWGTTATPYTDAQIDQQSQLIRGQAGRAIRNDRDNPGRTVEIFVMPGSADSAYLQGLSNSRADITISKTIIGTGEIAVGTEGVLTNNGQAGRAGSTISDDQYSFEFNLWNDLRGSI